MIQGNSEASKACTSEKNAEKDQVVTKDDDPMNEEITSEEDSNDDESIQKPSLKKLTLKRPVREENAMISAKKQKLEDFLVSAEAAFTSFVPFRNQTIQKWNEKTQFAGGKYNRKSGAQQTSTLRQIQHILSNKERLLKRTQVRRSQYSRIGQAALQVSGETALEQEDPEIFDDDDFYHQLLRELIERKTSSVNDPIQLSHHWLELQKLRTKLKRNVDTKASKGRKIRYDVHSKLVNFMAPHDTCGMSSAAVKELFGSLFGKMKE